MRLSKNFFFGELDGRATLVPVADTSFHGMVDGNKTLSAILECLKDDVTENEIVDKLFLQFTADKDVIKSDVSKALKKLREIGAIEE